METIEFEKQGGSTGEVISSVLSAVGRAIQGGDAAIVTTVSSPFVSNEPGGGQSREDSDEPDRGGRRPADWDSYRQLRGVASGGWKK